MISKMLAFLLATGLCLAIQGCTKRAWYEGLQQAQRQECYKNQSESDVQKCLDNSNSTTYDQYIQDRETAKKQGGDGR
jgi:hypothetical protein